MSSLSVFLLFANKFQNQEKWRVKWYVQYSYMYVNLVWKMQSYANIEMYILVLGGLSITELSLVNEKWHL